MHGAQQAEKSPATIFVTGTPRLVLFYKESERL